MVKTYLTSRQTYTSPDTSVTRIQLERNFADSLTKDNVQINDMYLDELEDEDFE